jgi:curved DNA-binding protein CbpA
MGNVENYYDILGVSYDATFNEIKEAFRKKVKEVHPDKEKGNATQFNRVKKAYDVLKNVEKRRRYDDFLFKNFNDISQDLKKEAPHRTNPTITVVNIRKNKGKRTTLATVTINAAVIMLGILGNRQASNSRMPVYRLLIPSRPKIT